MSGEEVLETQVSLKMSRGGDNSTVVVRPMANQLQRLRFLLPFQRIHVEGPQIPRCASDIGSIWVEMLGGHGSDFRRPGLRWAQIPFGNRSFAGIYRLDNQFIESVVGGRERSSGQKSRKLGDHRLQRKVARPDA